MWPASFTPRTVVFSSVLEGVLSPVCGFDENHLAGEIDLSDNSLDGIDDVFGNRKVRDRGYHQGSEK